MALPFDPKDPNDPGSPFPKKPPRTTPPPRPEQAPSSPSSDLALTFPEAGRAIPVVHGTAKVMGTVIEQYSSILYAGPFSAPSWLSRALYSVGDRVTANGNTYVCTRAGVSADTGTGPSGTGTGIVDGITGPPLDYAVRWDFMRPGTDLIWKQSTAYTSPAFGIGGATIYNNGNFYDCITSGTSAATGIGPSGISDDITDGTVHWKYIKPGWRTSMAVAYCEGQIFGAGTAWSDATTNLGLRNDTFRPNAYLVAFPKDHIQLFTGTPAGITRPAWFPTPDAIVADPYSNVAVLLFIASTGMDQKISNIALEIQSGTGVDATHVDENPADIAIDLLTHQRRGAGWATARVDTTGTLGVGAASYRTYCTAFGLLLSWVIDTQTTTMELLGMLLAATNSDPVWSNGGSLGGMLKIVPRGDQALTANGVTYAPVTTPLFNLTQDDIIAGSLEVSRPSSTSAFNSYPIEFTDRSLGYVRNLVDDPDMADVDKRGLLRAPTVALPQVIASASAVMLSRIYAQRSLRVRNVYRFRLSHRFMLLEPTDVVTLADSVMGMPARPVKITTMEEEQVDGTFLFEAEDYPVAVHAAALYTPQTGDGFQPNRGTSTTEGVVLSSQTATGTIVDSASTRGAAVHNMWPNGSSELSPPDGSSLTTPEWVGRVNAGTGAYAGSWVREVSAPRTGAGVGLGDGPSPFTTNMSSLCLKVKTSPGETFSFEAQARGTVAPTGTTLAQGYLAVVFLDANDVQIVGSGYSINVGGFTVGGGYKLIAGRGLVCPAGTCSALFCLISDAQGTGSGGTNTVHFDAIVVAKMTDASSDAATTAPALTLAAAGNVFTDIPGTSQSFIPNTGSRRVKVTLAFSGFAPATGANGQQNVRIVFGGTPTQAGSIYNLWWNTANQHQSWTFMWSFVPAIFGPVGTAVVVKAQIRSPTGSNASFTMDANDSAAMIIEEIG